MLGVTGISAAETISINFYHTDDNHQVGVSDSLGLVAAQNWNNIEVQESSDLDETAPYTGDNIVTGLALTDSTGTATLTTAGYRAGVQAERDTPDSVVTGSAPYSADKNMMRSMFYGDKGGQGDNLKNEYVEILGLSSAFTSAGYDVYFYSVASDRDAKGRFDLDTNSDGNLDGATDLSTFEVTTGTTAFDGTYDIVTSDGDTGNVFVLKGLTASSFRATISQTSGKEFGITGLQIVAVPEPASLALVALGGLLMVGRRRAAA
jgi:hypothetical protein